jgi:hypothetical protein
MWTGSPQGFDAVKKMGSILRQPRRLARACGIWVQAPREPTGYEVMWTCSAVDREADPDVVCKPFRCRAPALTRYASYEGVRRNSRSKINAGGKCT